MRALARLPDGPMFGKKSLVRTALRVISGNNSLITGAYRHALSTKFSVFYLLLVLNSFIFNKDA